MRQRRQVSYQWRLRELMAARGMFTATELVPLLAGRGIGLSSSQAHRLVSGTPERLSLAVLAALCDILDVTPAELIAARAGNMARARPRPRACRRSRTWLPSGPSAPGCARSRPVPYRTREQYERWHIRGCARRGRRGGLAANWEGPVCRTCHGKAARTCGRCAGCGAGRLLPGRRGDGAATCRDCAGITRDFTCARCGREALLLAGRLCERCTPEEQLAAILDDGTGQVRPPMRSLLDTVLSTVRPKSGLQWLRDPRVPGLLAGLATGAIPLTHEALHGLPDCGWSATCEAC